MKNILLLMIYNTQGIKKRVDIFWAKLNLPAGRQVTASRLYLRRIC
jgi:hypothetical protein